MDAPHRMLLLLQGDVGSAKTVVALLASRTAVEGGVLSTLMAPTEILARQHFNTLEPLAQAAGVAIVLLTGRDKGKARQAILDGLAAGETPLVVAEGQLSGAVHMLLDVSARHTAEIQAAHLAAAVASSTDAIIRQSLNGIVQSWNAGAEQIFRSEEHTSELQSLMRISYAVICLKKKK